MATRKCSICKELIELDNNSENYFIEYKDKCSFCYHTKCYIERHTKKKCYSKTEEECIKYIEECREVAKAIQKKKNMRDELYQFLFKMYDKSFFSSSFYIKMESVYKGTYKGLNRPVPPEDLLDMWQQKSNYLNKVAEQNRKRGVDISGINRVNYDLAILLSRYDDYLKWKEQQEIAVAEMNDSKMRSVEKIEYTDVIRPNNNKQITYEKIDISSILDEI